MKNPEHKTIKYKAEIELTSPLKLTMPPEFFDVQKVVDMGAKKHGMNSFLEPGVFTMKRTQSQFRHLMKKTGLWNLHSKSNDLLTLNDFAVLGAMNVILCALQHVKYKKENRLDKESGLPHELHEACNALMFYTAIERGVIKQDD